MPTELTDAEIKKLVADNAKLRTENISFRMQDEIAVINLKRGDIRLRAETSLAPALLAQFDYDDSAGAFKPKQGSPAGLTLASAIDSLRESHAYCFVESQTDTKPTTGEQRFGGFAPDSKASDDFFSISPEEKIRIANERARPKGW